MQSLRFEKYRKIFFYILIGIAFCMILAYNALTPYLSDDISYKVEVNTARSLWDLVKQQYGEYLSNSGRVIGQFNIRLSLVGSKMIFNVVNSIMFIILSLLIYVNVSYRRKHDCLLYLLIIGMLWRYSVEFGQTMLWLCGACNYLWGSVYILGFVTFYRSRLKRMDQIRRPVLLAAGTFLFGLVAGWCNENTSGGGLLLILMFSVLTVINRKKEGKRPVMPFMVTAHAGMICGLLGMVSAPGIAKRAATMSDNYTGMVAYVSRFYKATMMIRELFFELLIIFIIVTVIVIVKNKYRLPQKADSFVFFIGGAATAYALILAPPPQERAYFGAGIFLMIACLQGFAEIFYDMNRESLFNAVKYIVVVVLMLWLFFTYMDNLVNLARIYREDNERIELLKEAKAEGISPAVIPQYREAFANPYSNAHASDMTEDPKYWINHFYEGYYGLGRIIAIPRDEWDELYGGEE